MNDRRRAVAVALLVAALFALPALPLANSKVLTLSIQMFTVAALASSWNILGGYAGQINLGHAAFFGLGALTTRLLWLSGTSYAISFVAGSLAAAVVALIIGAPAFRLRGAYFAIGTLAAAEALNLTVANILPGNSALPAALLASYDLRPRYYLLLSLLVFIVGASALIKRSRLGLGMMAVREDEEAAQSIGVDVFRYKLLAFVISAWMAGLVGSAFAYFHVSYYYQSTFTPIWTFDAVLVAFIGGVGTIAGPLLGAGFFVLIRDVLATNITNFHLIIFGILFILVVLLLPGGLMEAWDRLARFRRASLSSTLSSQAPAD